MDIEEWPKFMKVNQELRCQRETKVPGKVIAQLFGSKQNTETYAFGVSGGELGGARCTHAEITGHFSKSE